MTPFMETASEFVTPQTLSRARTVPSMLTSLRRELQTVIPLEGISVLLKDLTTGRADLHSETESIRVDDLEKKGGCNEHFLREMHYLSTQLGTPNLAMPDASRPSMVVPLTLVESRPGALIFSFSSSSFVSDEKVFLLHEVAKLADVSLSNSLDVSAALNLLLHNYKKQFVEQRREFETLLDINKAVLANLDMQAVVREVALILRRISGPDSYVLMLTDPALKVIQVVAKDFVSGYESKDTMLTGSINHDYPAGITIDSRTPVFLGGKRITDLVNRKASGDAIWIDSSKFFRAEGCRATISAPLIAHGKLLGIFGGSYNREVRVEVDEMKLFENVAGQLSLAVESALAQRQLAMPKIPDNRERCYLQLENRGATKFDRFVGNSHALTEILAKVERVAPTDATVLICGETGTGKELVARAIHELSHRHSRALVKINCAAIPAALLESELFGYEKGAFTGACVQKVGRVELAQGGTLFLDEIGDMPLDLQPKLLRVLQEREFERLGGKRTINVDIRVIAATNRNLSQLVTNRQFRSDLYYRLSVFPITVPPLRERRTDIAELVQYFVTRFATRLNKRIDSIPVETMTLLEQAPWVGNIRELENVIERAVILSSPGVLKISPFEIKELVESGSSPGIQERNVLGDSSLESVERAHILKVLEQTRGRISGPEGAAARLGVVRTTLNSRLRRLGISAHDLRRMRSK